MPVQFFTEDISYTLKNKRKTAEWIKAVINSAEKKTGHINFIFCSDKYLQEINESYLKHKSLTDIISFQYNTENENLLSGDIFISIDRIKENAKTYNTKFLAELHRVVIHGILHFCGYKDKTPSEKEKMREMEEKALRLLPNFK